MKGVVTTFIERGIRLGGITDTTKFINLRTKLTDTIRETVEAHSSLALDSKADREALIRDLIWALC